MDDGKKMAHDMHKGHDMAAKGMISSKSARTPRTVLSQQSR